MEGGCLCGSVRFETAGEPVHVSYCHCRMCQKATGGTFSAMAGFPADQISWRGHPKLRRSSPFSVRGFCGECGTPLTFEYDDATHVSISIGAFDDPAALPPREHGGIESKLPWVDIAADLPTERCDDDPDYRRLVKETNWTPPFDSD